MILGQEKVTRRTACTVQHRAAQAGNRDLHQVRPERGRHRCRARLPDEAFAQGLVQGLSGAWGGQAPEAATGAQVHLGDEAGCRGLLPRARKEPRRDHAQDGLSRRQGVPLRLDRRARPRAKEMQGAEPEGGPCPARGEGTDGGRARVPQRNRCGGRRRARRPTYGAGRQRAIMSGTPKRKAFP